MASAKTETGDRILLSLQGFCARLLRENFDGLFILASLIAIGVILRLLDHKLSYLSFFYIPVLLAGYYKSTRSAVLGALFAVSWVTFFVVLDPGSFSPELGPVRLYFHIVVWGAFLVMTGAIVGTLSEQSRMRHRRICDTLDDLNQLKDHIIEKNRFLEFQNRRLESSREHLESVVNSAMDPYLAQLVSQQKACSERRCLSVLCAGLPDFAAHGQTRDPEAVVEDLDWFFSAMEPVLTRFRGHLDRLQADGLVAEFGAPHRAANHSLQAVLAALRMQQRLGHQQFPWKLQIGVATGTALVGLMGSAHRKCYTAMGEAVDRAARLQALCPRGSVCVDEGVFGVVGRWFRTRPLRRSARPDRDAAATVAVRVRPMAEAYEVLGLKDFLESRERVPAAAAQAYQRHAPQAELSEDLMLAIEACDGSLGHSQVAAALCAAMAERMGLEDSQVRTAFLAGYYHDAGRRSIPAHLLDREPHLAQLPRTDQDAVKAHVLEASRVLPDIGGPDDPEVAEVVLQHHERFDGRGYPAGLSGQRIHVLARILHLADAYEELTGWRAYKEPWPSGEAIAELQRRAQAGEFDPRVAEVFFSLMRPA